MNGARKSLINTLREWKNNRATFGEIVDALEDYLIERETVSVDSSEVDYIFCGCCMLTHPANINCDIVTWDQNGNIVSPKKESNHPWWRYYEKYHWLQPWTKNAREQLKRLEKRAADLQKKTKRL